MLELFQMYDIGSENKWNLSKSLWNLYFRVKSFVIYRLNVKNRVK